MNSPSWLISLLTSEDTCSTSWQPFLNSLSLPAGAVLSAIALWVASKAHATSKDALSTSQGAVALSLADSRSQHGTEPQGRHEAR